MSAGGVVVPRCAALFVRADSVYKSLPGVECFDVERDARNYSGALPVVAHPPCRAWGRLRHFAKPRQDEKALAIFAVVEVRRCGGVLEHPAGSSLWAGAGLPKPGSFDGFGGWTFPVDQNWWGHRARKATWLYVVGCRPVDVPAMCFSLGEASHVISSCLRGARRRPEVSRAEREHTPPAMAAWLVELAVRCGK